MKKHSECIDREPGIESTFSIINQMCRNARVKGAVQDPGTRKNDFSPGHASCMSSLRGSGV